MSFMQDLGGTLLLQYQKGGYAMHPIAVLSVVSAALVIYKLIVFRRAKTNVVALTAGVRRSVLDGKIGDAIGVCESHRGPVSVVLKAGLLQCDAPRDEVERHMEAAAVGVLARLQRYLGGLATIANVAPLLGFLGTVVGMILSFEAIARESMGNPEKVAHGIAVALLTTAFGLLVAVMTQPFYNYFLGRVADHANQIEVAMHAVVDALNRRQRSLPAGPEAPPGSRS